MSSTPSCKSSATREGVETRAVTPTRWTSPMCN